MEAEKNLNLKKTFSIESYNNGDWEPSQDWIQMEILEPVSTPAIFGKIGAKNECFWINKTGNRSTVGKLEKVYEGGRNSKGFAADEGHTIWRRRWKGDEALKKEKKKNGYFRN